MNAAHTPGPWQAQPWRYRNPERKVLTIQTERDAVAQLLDLWPPDAREAEKAANAHLIAAAPDLLAALRDICTADETSTLDGAVAIARAAIARAEGKG